MISLFFFLLVAEGNSQEVATPSSLLGPRHFNHHAFDAEAYLRSLNLPVPTKQGPVLFPNDGTPAPRPPLVVTSRPLIESIVNSNLNPLPQNNTLASSSNSLPSVPYFGRHKNYKPFYGVDAGLSDGFNKDNYDYEAIPPINYNGISNHITSELHQEPKRYEIQVNDPDYTHQQSNEIHDETSSEYNNGQNYAFSYSVKDRKTGDDFSHSQKSKGSATNGEYRVRLPDGRMQIVSYTADENGYKADVRYDDERPLSNTATNNNGYNVIPNSYNDNHKQRNDNVDYINHNTKYDYTDNNYITNDKVNTDYDINNAVQRDFKYNKQVPKDYYNSYDSREYFNEDYSSEYNNNYRPYQSKFSKLLNDRIEGNSLSNVQVSSTIKPSYGELKDLFVTKSLYDTRQSYNNGISTSKYTDYVPTTETVIIGTKPSVYANLKHNIIPLFSTPITATTPRSYLLSTIASLKNKIVQPVLSERFIDKINKYLTFN